jgi:hypothetical protein
MKKTQRGKMDPEYISRVTVMAVGVEAYTGMHRLRGSKVDVETLFNTLVRSPRTALYQNNPFIKLINPTSEELRTRLTSYALDRSAQGDILIFYFSGHGIPVGYDDFGFCTIDTIVHPQANSVLPLTVLKFSDLLGTLSIVGVVPVVIIDACYSGLAGEVLISAQKIITAMQTIITRTSASNYALLCSCSELQTTSDGHEGGFFSRCLFQLLDRGLEHNPPLVSLRDLFNPLTQLVEEQAEVNPRLFIGDTLTDFPISRNTLYTPQRYSLVSHLKKVILALWNDGNERELDRGEIQGFCGPGTGAYGNHNKLSYEPWQLVDNNPATRKRRLTEGGRLFVQGKLTIPRNIIKDPISKRWIAEQDSPQISFQDD